MRGVSLVLHEAMQFMYEKRAFFAVFARFFMDFHGSFFTRFSKKGTFYTKTAF